MRTLRILSVLALLVLFEPYSWAQKAETTSEVIFVDVSGKNGNAPTTITVTSPDNLEEVTRGFARVKGTKINLSGLILDEDGIGSASVNGVTIELSSSGAFSLPLTLPEGEQTISFLVRDANGNESTKEYSVKVEDVPLVAGLTSEVGDYYALLIGINDYDDPSLQDLTNPIKDARELKNVLETNYYFKHENIVLLENATSRDIKYSLDDLSRKVGPADNLLIFYAGHGYWEAEYENGYWIPSDGKKDNRVDWYGNGTLIDQLRTIRTKHTLLIADACFAGGIFKTRKAFSDAPSGVNKLYALPSRKAMTSGFLEEVPDKSVFIKYLIRRLESNTQKYLSSEQLFSRMFDAVANNQDQLPKYGTIQKVGDEGGDFIFIRRD